MKRILVYGANGFTGRLIIDRLNNLDVDLTLAGRNETSMAKLGAQHKLPARAFSLENKRTVLKQLSDFDLVINCAGPFRETATILADAAIKNHCHYFDISGEISCFQDLLKRDKQARDNNVALIPGLGFDIVPSECLAALVAQELKDTKSLTIAIKPRHVVPSHGTLKTAIFSIKKTALARRKQGIKAYPKISNIEHIEIDGRGTSCMRAPLPDLLCSHISTGVEHIDTFIAVPKSARIALSLMKRASPLLKIGVVEKLVAGFIHRLPNGPTIKQQQTGSAIIYCEGKSNKGSLIGLMKTYEPYCYTADSIKKAVELYLQNGVKTGFLTPSQAFGANFAEHVDQRRVSVEYIKNSHE